MDLSGILDLFGHSVYCSKIKAFLKLCDAPFDGKRRLGRYGSVDSQSLGVSLWFWWKRYYREQIGEPHDTVEPDDSGETVLKEVRFTPKGLAKTALPFGLSFPATPDSVIDAFGRKPFSKTKNVVGNAVWTYYEDAFELLVRFDADGEEVECFKIIALGRKERQKLELLENLAEQKKNILPERIPEVEALIERNPTVAWERRMNSGDTQITAEAVEASQQAFVEFITGVCKATKTRNAKSIYAAMKKATKAFNKVARQHKGFIETMEREEIVEFFNTAIKLTGFQFDPSFDLAEEYRSW